MSFQQVLVEAGFSAADASRLSGSEYFAARHSNKSADEIARKIAEIAEIYKTDSEAIRKAVLTHPPFANYDHTRVLNGIQEVYGASKEQAAKAVLTHPPFAGLDHTRVLNGIQEVYGASKEQAAKAVLTHPPFAGLDHTRVLRQQTRIGSLVGVEEERVRKEILVRPRLAGYSAKRYLAVIDVFRHLDGTLDGIPRERMVDWWLRNPTKSPYVPGTKRERINHVAKQGIAAEPDLMIALRKSEHKLRVAT